MPNSDSGSKPNPGTDNPRVKSFLQQASAIIASEKGLNLASQQKLQNLAEHLKMPQAELHQALALLQENDKLPEGLNRYEKKFVEFLRTEFRELSRGIITISMENKAVDLAARKYDILEPRARKLIHQQAEAMGVGRISKGDAEDYVEQLIVSRIGDASRIEEVARERFYGIAEKWGVDSTQVDAIVLQALANNRKQESSESGRTRLPWVTALLLVLLIGVGAIFAVNARDWWTETVLEDDPDPKDAVVDTVDDQLTVPDWWKLQGMVEIVGDLRDEKLGLGWASDLASENLDRQRDGLDELWRQTKQSGLSSRPLLMKFLAEYYFACPDPKNAAHVLDRLKLDLRIPASRIPADIDKMSACYAANDAIGKFKFFKPSQPNTLSGSRRELVEHLIVSEFGRSELGEDLAAYRDATENVIAINQWNHLIQTSWASPKRTSLLIGPLFELTQSRLSVQELDRFHRRTLMSVLESNQSLWVDLEGEVQRAIMSSPPNAVNTWINHYQTAFDESYQTWLGLQLVEKCGLKLERSSRIEVAEALRRYKTSSRREQFRDLLTRNEKIDLINQELRMRVRTEGFSPQLIADVSRSVTLSMFLSPYDQSSFSFEAFDLLYRRGTPNLATLARKSLDLVAGGATGDATPSEIQKLDDAFERLELLRGSKLESRFAALKRLSEVAGKFDDISYENASVLASYFLGISSDRERVQAEKLLPEFISWPTFGLAISDQMVDNSTTLDGALTMARYYSEGDPFELENPTFWREEIRRFLFRAAMAKIEQAKIKVTEASQRWYFLRVEYAQMCELRLRAFGFNSYVANQDSPVNATREMVKFMQQQNSVTTDYPVERAIDVLEDQSGSEFEELVALNYVAVKLLAQRIVTRWPDQVENVKSIVEQLDPEERATTGELLLKAEFAQLELWSLERQSIVERLLAR